MRAVDLIGEDLILPRLRARRARDVIPELGAFLAAHHPGVSERDAVRVLSEREQLGSTAVGEGLAIPHAKLGTARSLLACMGRSRRGIDFASPDDQPTHFFFVLIAPEQAQGDHLKALARISRLFRSDEMRTGLLTAETAQEMYEIMTTAEAGLENR